MKVKKEKKTTKTKNKKKTNKANDKASATEKINRKQGKV